MKKLLVGMVALLATAGMAMGAGFSVGSATGAQGATVVIPISATGNGALQGVNLTLQVAAPLEIIGATLAGGLFAANNTGMSAILFPDAPVPQVALVGTTTSSGTVPAPGVLAMISIKIPADAPVGAYALQTTIPSMEWSSDFAGSAGVSVDGQGSGLITVTPEPATALLLLGVLPLLRRRR